MEDLTFQRPSGCQIKTDAPQDGASSYLLFDLAGDESGAGNPLLADFILTGQRLERLGFTYYKDAVLLIDTLEMQ